MERRRNRCAGRRGDHGAQRGARRLRPRQPDRDRRQHSCGVGALERERRSGAPRVADGRYRLPCTRRLLGRPVRRRACRAPPRRTQSPGHRLDRSYCAGHVQPRCRQSPHGPRARQLRAPHRSSRDPRRRSACQHGARGTAPQRDARLVVRRPTRRPRDRHLRRPRRASVPSVTSYAAARAALRAPSDAARVRSRGVRRAATACSRR